MEEKVISTSQGRFVIRPYRSGDERAILASWQAAFGKEMSLEEWRWKYQEAPEGFRALLCVAEDGTVAVHYAAQVVPVCCGPEAILGLHLVDSFSHPRFRWALGGKRGLFVLTVWSFFRTFVEWVEVPGGWALETDLPRAQFRYGFPGKRHFRLGIKLLGYRPHGPGLYFLRAEGQGRRVPEGEEIPWRALEALFEATRDPALFCVPRKGPFLSWRLRRPGRKYLFFCTKTLWRQKLKAWIILSPLEAGAWVLLDFWARGEGALEGLLRAILAEVPGEVRVWLAANHPLRRAFFRAGFLRAEEPLGLVPSTRLDVPGRPTEAADFFSFTMADADLF